MLMYRQAGASSAELRDAVGISMLHDNAFDEYLRNNHAIEEVFASGEFGLSEGAQVHPSTAMLKKRAVHCIEGERAAQKLPFETDVKNAILWHHENADGTGPLGLDAAHTSLVSQLIHLADVLDITCGITKIGAEEFAQVTAFVQSQKGKKFSDRAVELFCQGVQLEDVRRMQELGPEACLREAIPGHVVDYSRDQVRDIADFYASIIDHKSSFTMVHSMEVADKALRMAERYAWPEDRATRFFLAGALHDIGKMIVPTGILEKPDRLTNDEYAKIKDHAAATRLVLSHLSGMEDVTHWAANHHEKLDGTGYALGLKAEDLVFEDRLMGCIDIYQALTENRPYKDGLSHAKAISIMRGMAEDNKIDPGIVEDMNEEFDTGVEVAEEAPTGKRRWKCPVCGYIFEGEEPPAICPLCGIPGYRFLPL